MVVCRMDAVATHPGIASLVSSSCAQKGGMQTERSFTESLSLKSFQCCVWATLKANA